MRNTRTITVGNFTLQRRVPRFGTQLSLNMPDFKGFMVAMDAHSVLPVLRPTHKARHPCSARALGERSVLQSNNIDDDRDTPVGKKLEYLPEARRLCEAWTSCGVSGFLASAQRGSKTVLAPPDALECVLVGFQVAWEEN